MCSTRVGFSLPAAARTCRCRVISSPECATVRSHVRYSNALSITLRTSDRLLAEWRNAHDAHPDDLAERADPDSAGPGAAGRPPWPARTPGSSAVETGRCAPAVPGHWRVDVDGATPAAPDYAGDHGGAGPARGTDHRVARVGGPFRRHAARRLRPGGGPDARPACRG